MRIHVLGHSDSNLDERTADWPVLLKTLLQRETHGPVEISGSQLAPYGPRAVTYALRRVGEAAPDLVLLSVSAFTCTVGLVHLRVGQRFGARAQRLFQVTEQRYSRVASRNPTLSPTPDRFLRRAAKKLVGTSTLAPVEEVGAVYADILHGLARSESVHVLVMGESFFSRELQHANPGMLTKIETLQSIVRTAAVAHRFAWVDIEAAFASASDRESHYLSDGVHNSPAGHQRVAQAMATAILRTLTPVAAPP